MDRGSERSFEKVLFCLLPVFIALSLLFCPAAEAYIYDDFSSVGVDTGKWTISDPFHLFSQPGDGQLYFSSDNTAGVSPPPGGALVSTSSFTNGFISMDFSDFVSSNTSPGGQGKGSFAAIGLGTKSSYVRMLRGRVISPAWGYFEANYFDGAVLHVWYVFADVTSGQLGFYYDGSTVSFFYNDGFAGWQKLDTSGPDTKGITVTVTPGWSSPQPIFISGTPGASGATSFAVDKVEYRSVPPPTALTLYDNFSKAYIDTTKWRESEWVRQIDPSSQRLLVKQANPGPAAIHAYPYHNDNGLNFSDPSSVHSIQADVTILQDNITNNGFTRVRLAGRWYNDGTQGEGMTGDIHAEVALKDGPTGYFARWSVARMANADGSTSNSLGYGDFSVPITAGTAYTLYISYDPSLNEFTFKAGTEQQTFSPISPPPPMEPPKSPWKALDTRVEVSDATSSCYVSAAFGNLYKNDVLYDDFSLTTIDSTKWTDYEVIKEIVGGQLSLGIRSSSASASAIYNRLEFVDPSSINIFQAEVTPLAYQNNEGVPGTIARIAGHYYNDGTPGGGYLGLVGGMVSIGGAGVNPIANWQVFKYNDFDGNPDNVTAIAQGNFNTPILINNTYTLSIGWDGFQFIFKFDDEVGYYTPGGSVNPPNIPWKELGARLLNPSGREAVIEALFDNVMVTPIFNALTPSGSNISVSPPGSGTAITFSNVSTPGNTSVTISASGATPPAGFQLGTPPTYYDISTTATYNPPVKVCVVYDPYQYIDPSQAHLFHYENGAWADITTSNDLTYHTICGQVNGLSPFVIAQIDRPPTITAVSVNPSVLWPPNSKMVNVTVDYTATDDWGQPVCQISNVTSNEQIHSSDYTILDAHHVGLRAERSGGGHGRVYTLAISCTDGSGNSSSQTVTVTVPHDQGKK